MVKNNIYLQLAHAASLGYCSDTWQEFQGKKKPIATHSFITHQKGFLDAWEEGTVEGEDC